MRRAVLVVLSLALLPAGPARAGFTGACHGPAAAFVAVSFDAAVRSDFLQDVDHFRSFATELKNSYCLPEERVMIRAMGGIARGSYWYDAGTEAGFKRDIARAGRMAAADPSMTVFVMLSSHGMFYANGPGGRCAGATPAVGSLSLLRGGEGEDGLLYDCELGSFLNDQIPSGTATMVAVDCSFCGGFSDSLTAASGTAPDDAATTTSGVPGPGRIVITGCAVTTECFGGDEGGVLYEHLDNALTSTGCNGWTAPGFPALQGLNVPVRLHEGDAVCTASEWFFGAVASAYAERDPYEVQEQFRIKYGYGSLAEDIPVLPAP